MQLGLYNGRKTAAGTRCMHYKFETVAEWLVCWTQAQKGPGSNHSRDAVG